MARTESQRKFGLPRGRNLPFTLESRKGNYQRARFQKRWPQPKLNSPVPMELRWKSIVKYITTFNFKVKSEIQIDVSIFYNTMQKLIWNGHWKHIILPFWHFISDRRPWRHPTAKVDITIKIAEKSNIWINHALNRL